MSLGGFGDSTLAAPLHNALRLRFPDAHISAITMWKSSAVFLSHLGIFDEVISHNFLQSSLGKSLGVVWKLRRQKFDLSILTFPSNRVHYNILARMIGARYRLGHNYLKGNFFTYCRFLLTHRVTQTRRIHCIEENAKLAEVLGIKCEIPEVNAGNLGMDQTPWAEEYLLGKEKPFIGIHPGCSPLKNHTRRRWPAEKYATLAQELIQNRLGTPLIFLGPDEQDLKQTFQQIAPDAIIVPLQGIERITALIRNCDIMVCNDSSLGHLAVACKIPVVSIFGPVNPDYTRPRGVPHRIVSLNLPCSPCFDYSKHPLQCRENKNFVCVTEIKVSEVLGACVSLLDEVRSKETICHEHIYA